jgi:hypothetical protein
MLIAWNDLRKIEEGRIMVRIFEVCFNAIFRAAAS